MKRALICTVGTGPNVTDTLVRVVRSCRPDAVYFLVTSESDAEARATAEELGEEMPKWETVQVRNPELLDTCFEDAVRAFRMAADDGFGADELWCEYTRGTKAMSAAVVLAGIAAGCSHYSYIGGERGGETKTVLHGTERLLQSSATNIAAAANIRLARELFSQHDYGGCAQVLQAVCEGTGDPRVCQEAEPLLQLAHGYWLWDRFNHEEARDALKEACKSAGQLGIDLQGNMRFLSRVIKAREAYAESKRAASPVKHCRAKYDPVFLADMLNSAERRFEMGQYDDAVARLYRSLELMGQIALARLDPPIDAACVKLADLPQEAQEEFAIEADEDGTFKSGAVTNFRILALVGDLNGLAAWFSGKPSLRGLLNARNDSIVAHGLSPVAPETYLSFRDTIGPQAGASEPKLGEWRTEATFVRLPE